MHTLLILNPGHFHAALVLRERHPSLSDDIYVYSEPGPDVDHFLEIAESFNQRPTNPTRWQINVYKGSDYLQKLIHESKGDIVVLAGRNGSGKTVLVRHFNGLLEPTSGRVVVDGVPVDEDPIRARRLVGMVFQDAEAQIVGETVFEEVAFGPRNLGEKTAEIERRVLGALSSLGLAHRREALPHHLSGGERRRLTIAGVLVMKPRVLVLDEPLAGLDYEEFEEMLHTVATVADEWDDKLLAQFGGG